MATARDTMRRWSSCAVRSLNAATKLPPLDEWVLLYQRETHGLERELLGDGQVGKLLHTVCDAERLVESRQALLPPSVTRRVS